MIDVDPFVAGRKRLFALAYRLLGSAAEADDVVADVGERWLRADVAGIERPDAWLTTVTTRRALEVLRSARVQRESYPGVWLPEPVADDELPEEIVARADSLSFGFLLLLERLSPMERGAFVLHDVFGYPHREAAELLGTTEPAARKAASRGRARVGSDAHEARSVDPTEADAVAAAFMAALGTGEVRDVVGLLTEDAVEISDGGGVVYAGQYPVVGAERVARLLVNLFGRIDDDLWALPLRLNSLPAVVAHDGRGWLTLAIRTRDHRVDAVYSVVNPAKLERLVRRVDPDRARPEPSITSRRIAGR